jgi:hypothetical protein
MSLIYDTNRNPSLSEIAEGGSIFGLNGDDSLNYNFTKIADTTSSPFSAPFEELRFPAINDAGTVTFGASTQEESGIFTLSDGLITTIADTNGPFGLLGTPAINNLGTVVFQAVLDGGTLDGVGPGVGIYTGSGGALTTISFDAETTNAILVSQPSINDNGVVAFVDNDSGDLYTGDGESLTFIANTDGSEPFINNLGTLSFILPDTGLVTRNGNVTTTIADTNGSFASLSGNASPINNEDTVAFVGFLESGDEGIFTSNGELVTTIADTSGPFFNILAPSINDQGTVAFFANLDTGGEGIFTGPDPVADKVIATGDTLLGSNVINISSFNVDKLNNHGQITFIADLADGTTGIFVADPISTTLSIIDGTSGRDTLNGTSQNDRITGLRGADILTGGLGNNVFLYTSIRDAGDTITDFELGSDYIDLSKIFQNHNLNGYSYDDAISGGYLGFRTQGNDTTVLIDPDGSADYGFFTPLVTVSGVDVETLDNANNFII